MDNGTILKNKLIEGVAEKLGIEGKVYILADRAQSNHRNKGFYKYMKEFIDKHIQRHLELDNVTHLSIVAHNYMSNQHLTE